MYGREDSYRWTSLRRGRFCDTGLAYDVAFWIRFLASHCGVAERNAALRSWNMDESVARIRGCRSLPCSWTRSLGERDSEDEQKMRCQLLDVLLSRFTL